MNRIFRKNQLIVTSLAIMIAVAGYLNFSGDEIAEFTQNQETMIQTMEGETDIPEGEIGEAVLTSATLESFVTDAKISREQIHAKAKENLENIINNSNVEEAQRQEAAAQLTRLSDRMEKQMAAEEILGTKGFLNCVVSINDDSVDVAVPNQDLSAVSRAQIEDTICRTCGCELDEIVITKMKINK